MPCVSVVFGTSHGFPHPNPHLVHQNNNPSGYRWWPHWRPPAQEGGVEHGGGKTRRNDVDGMLTSISLLMHLIFFLGERKRVFFGLVNGMLMDDIAQELWCKSPGSFWGVDHFISTLHRLTTIFLPRKSWWWATNLENWIGLGVDGFGFTIWASNWVASGSLNLIPPKIQHKRSFMQIIYYHFYMLPRARGEECSRHHAPNPHLTSLYTSCNNTWQLKLALRLIKLIPNFWYCQMYHHNPRKIKFNHFIYFWSHY